LRPYSVPCGPRRTSTRCTSKNSVSYNRGFLTGIELKCCSTPESPLAATDDTPMPRIWKFEPVKLVFVNETFGTFSCRSVAWSICRRSRASPLKAATAIGTSMRFSSRRCAVTITMSMTCVSLDVLEGVCA